jgi:(1->4)-alpha-D-glucan 1-alpha-D-glucosylmutase
MDADGLVEPYYYDYWGNRVETSDATRRALLQAMGPKRASRRAEPPVVIALEGRVPVLPNPNEHWHVQLEDGDEYTGDLEELPLGYHGLRSRANDSTRPLIVCPSRCYLPPEMRRGRFWALSTQLYALRSERNWGIGDFSDLSALADIAGRAGARAIALNPLHQLHLHNPSSASPYSPSSRLFLNVLYIDIERIPEFGECDAAASGLERIRAGEFVEYLGVSRSKLSVLEKLYRIFAEQHLTRNDARAQTFKRFVERGGTALERLAIYEALAEHFWLRNSAYGWRQWPFEYRSPASPEVIRFAIAHRTKIDFFLYLQWIAEGQLESAAANAGRANVSLYFDLAVGADVNGADVWSDQDAFVVDASLGAPADPLNTLGQNWGLAPFSPRALRQRAYSPFIELLRANMRHAGILRIDHVMALRRAFWIPRDAPASMGAYVSYPFDEMLPILALESVRNKCAVVGEDLGTVPEGFRERMEAAGALSTRVLYFQREWSDGSFLPPERYPRLAAVSIGTHDLPTLAGWWTGERSTGEDRAHDRLLLVEAFEAAFAIDSDGATRLREDAARGGTMAVVDDLSAAAYRFLGKTPSILPVVSMEDLLGEPGNVNVPGTFDEHPNWRRKRSLSLYELEDDKRLMRIGRVLSGR